MEERGPEQALVLTEAEAWLMNSRVRDLLEDADMPHVVEAGTMGLIMFEARFLSSPRPLALSIIRVLRDLQDLEEASILVTEEECWFLERRFRHNDREPEARALLLKLHKLILAFHTELDPPVPGDRTEVAEDVHDRTYQDALKDANQDANQEPDKDAGTDPEPGQGT